MLIKSEFICLKRKMCKGSDSPTILKYFLQNSAFTVCTHQSTTSYFIHPQWMSSKAS